MMSIKKTIIAIISLIIISFILPGAGTDKTDKTLTVTAIGKSSKNIENPAKARAMALRAARVEAYRKLAKAAGMEKKYRKGHIQKQIINAFMSGAQMIDKQFISDHKVKITMQIKKSRIVDLAAQLNNNNESHDK